MAASALRIRVSASRPSSGKMAMPTEQLTTSSRSSIMTGCETCSITFCATCAASEARRTSGSTTTNSSPPIRQMVSPSRRPPRPPPPPDREVGVALARLPHQPLRDFLQQQVADGMAERVVDRLEAVEVDEHHGDLLAIALAMRERLAQAIFQQPAVRQSGQRIVVGEVLCARLSFLQLGGALGDGALQRVARRFERLACRMLGGHVVVDPDGARTRQRGIDRLAHQLAPEGAAVLAAVLALGDDRAPVAHLLVPGGVALVILGRAVDRGGALADQLAGSITEHLLEAGIAALVGPVPDERDADRGVVEDQLLLGERPLHPPVGVPLRGDVLEAPDPFL